MVGLHPYSMWKIHEPGYTEDLAIVRPWKRLQPAICIESTLAIVKISYNEENQLESWHSR